MDALETFRAAVLTDAALCGRLAAFHDGDAFAQSAAAEAAARGIALEAAKIAAAAASDPAGARLLVPKPPTTRRWPAQGFVPVHLSQFAPAPTVTWAHAGGAPRGAALDRGAMRAILERPLNRFALARMTLDDVIDTAEPAPEPAGFVFHMSRAGSTLTANMLAALAGAAVLSEIEPVNAALWIVHTAPELSDARRIALLRAMLAAYGRTAQRLFVRFEAWHALALPLLGRAFPATPFVFLHREPVEVLASHEASEGRDLVSGLMAEEVWRFPDDVRRDAMAMTAYALGRICRAALAHRGRGIVVDHRALPEAVSARVLPHFGIAPDDEARARMRRVAKLDAKAPAGTPFLPDTAAKRARAGAALHALAERYVAPAYRALQQARKNPA